MIEWSKAIKAFIEKIEVVPTLVATIISIVFYKLILVDMLWTLVVGCCVYLAVYALKKSVNAIENYYSKCKYKRKKQIEQDRINQEKYRKSSLFYATLPNNIKKSLIALCKMPCQEYINCRILTPKNKAICGIIDDCEWLQRNSNMGDNYISVQTGLGSEQYIIFLDEWLYKVIIDNSSNV